MSERVVLVTGVAGFIGGQVAETFAARGDTVVGVDSSAPGDVAAAASLTRYESCHIPDPALVALVRDVVPDVVVHCAGRASVPDSLRDPADDFTSNTAMTFTVLDVLREAAPASHFLFPSSAAVYGDPVALPVREVDALAPISPYGFHKLQAEQLCREYAAVHGMRTTVLRIFSAYGPGLRRQVIWDICRKALAGSEVVLHGTGAESRDFIHVRDIAAVFALLAEAPGVELHTTCNVSSGVECRIDDLAELVIGALGIEVPIAFDQGDTPGKPSNWRADITRIHDLGFAPSVTLADGIAEVAGWARGQLSAS